MIFFKLIGPWWLTWPLVIGLVIFAIIIVLRHWSDAHRRSRWVMRGCLIILIALMCLRPSLPGSSGAAGMKNLNVFFVIDTSTSMSAEDYDGAKPRLDGAKSAIKALIPEMAGAHFSVITFNSVSNLEVPLTTDATALDGVADSLIVQQIYGASGSDISQPLEMLTAQLAAAKKDHPDRANLVYFMSDGEQTADKPIRSFAPIKQYIIGGAVLGYGTTQGGKMKDVFIYGSDTGEYIKDKTSGQSPEPDALSKLDESALKKIAGQLGVEYMHRQAPGDIKPLVSTLGVTQLANKQQKADSKSYADLDWVLAITTTVLLAIELGRVWPTYREVRTKWRRV